MGDSDFPSLSSTRLIRVLKKFGFVEKVNANNGRRMGRGSHTVLEHRDEPARRTTVQQGDLSKRLVASIASQAGLTADDINRGRPMK